jgi:signal transduction histidine kinase
MSDSKSDRPRSESVLVWLEHSLIACEVVRGSLTRVSAGFASHFGLSADSALQRDFASLFADADARVAQFKLDEVRTLGKGSSFLSKHRRSSEARVWLRWQLHLSDAESVYAVATDVTHERVLEEECSQLRHMLEHSQRLATIGLFASRVLHDLNNLLLPARQGVDLTLASLEEGHVNRGDLEVTRDCLNNATTLANEIRVHAGAARAEPQRLDLGELVSSTRPMFSLALRPGTEVSFELQKGTPKVLGHAVQLRQVLLNLVVNASEAIGDRGGKILVRVEPELGSGKSRGARLTVSDNGCGMSAETKAHLFEPFFSTKGTSRGLGLSGTLAILEQHRATIAIESEFGRGTQVEIRFP